MKIKRIKTTPTIDFFSADTTASLELVFVQKGISAGFPSPADDYLDIRMDLNKELIPNPSSTFLGRVKGLSMKDAGIDDQDILIVDKSLEPQNNRIAVCYIDGEFTLKRIKIENQSVYLMPANHEYKPIKISEANEFIVWGIVTYIIKRV